MIERDRMTYADDNEGCGVIEQFCRKCGKEIFVGRYGSYQECDNCKELES